MSIKGGYFMKVLHVDLSECKTHVEEVDEEFALKYIGGRGWGARLVWENMKEDTDPLSPENIIVIAPGPLSGLYLPSAGKTSFCSISPITGIYGDSNIGGMFGVELRQAGFDAVVIKGKAPELSYLWIDDDDIQLKSAGKYSDMGSIETEHLLREDIGDETVKVASIGPAGEKLVRMACITADWGRNAGRTGMGAVLGSKNLKAIAIRGTKDLPVADLPRLTRASDKAYRKLSQHNLFEFWQRQGLMSVIDYANTAGIIPTHNFKDTHFEEADMINGDVMELEYKIGDTACFSCPMACGNVNLVKDGKYAGTVIEGPEYETAAMFGSNVGISDFSAILRANYLCDEYGIDTITAGSLISVMIEAYEKDLVTLGELDGMALNWGDDESIMEMIRKIAFREGVGDTLAEGAYGVIKRWPQLAPLVNHVKGLDQSAYDARVAMTMALGYATSDIGAHHARAWPIAKELEMGANWDLNDKADLVIYHQTVRPLFDMLGVCRLPWIELGFDENTYAEFFSATVGIEFTLEELLKLSNDVYNLTRAINIRLGLVRDDDRPPERVFNDPIKTGPHAGKVLSRDEFKEILDIYYQRRGWDQDGIPTDETLKTSALEEAIEYMKPKRKAV
ncbi:MAG: aldehyde ferredoxin oxidoreductase family protein [ANME-2 cluster archaeon]|nr:aldehyde ferredoxin oxidoreductase family protein [ANME-2 cluster archaeon]